MGEWFADLQRHMAQHFDAVRERIVGKPDISTNIFQTVIQQLAVLYDRPPIIHHEDEVAAALATSLLAEAGWWSLGTHNQRFTLGLRENFIRPTLTSKGLLLRLVDTTTVVVEASPEEPDVPVKITEARIRCMDNVDGWYWDMFDISDPEFPTYKVIRAQDGEDVTLSMLGSDVYPAEFILADGTPILPYALYHAERTGKVFDWRTGIEAVEGTLTNAVLWSWWIHCVRDSSWAQRYGVDVRPQGSGIAGAGSSATSSVTTDPSSVMLFSSDGDKATLSQWNPAADPLTLGQALSDFEQRILVHFGLSPADVVRNQNAQSGYAISLRKGAVREAQRRMIPQFERGDKELLRIISALTSGAIPADGWGITYQGQPKSLEEVKAELEKHQTLIAAGLESKVDAYLDIHPGISRDQAVDDLRRINMENLSLNVSPRQARVRS